MPHSPLPATITALAHDGRGITHIDGKTVFIDGALIGEEVMFQYTHRSRQFDQAQVTDILRASPDRIEPVCPHTDICGGCNLQHMSPASQLQYKQNILLEQLQHFGKVNFTGELLPPLTGPTFGYRRKGRLSVRYVHKKNKVLVGFHEKNGRYVAELTDCAILDPALDVSLLELQQLIASLSIYRAIPQIEVAIGDNAVVLVLRHLQALTQADRTLLRDFGIQKNLSWYLQSGNASSLEPLDQPVSLTYALPAFNLLLEFAPLDFVQINGKINSQLVSRAVELLDIQSTDRVLDLFCGLGNFSLALARRAKHVVGIEGDMAMVQRATQNAIRNGITHAEFYMADLSQGLSSWSKQKYDKLLIDPARAGAWEVVQHVRKLGVQYILYISCNPATFARDAGELVHNQGYTLQKLGIVDMFPHTRHVECMGLFSRV